MRRRLIPPDPPRPAAPLSFDVCLVLDIQRRRHRWLPAEDRVAGRPLRGVESTTKDRAAQFEEPGAPPGRPNVNLDAPALHLLLKVLRREPAFAVHDEHIHGSERLIPRLAHRNQERGVAAVADALSAAPSGGAAPEV